MLGQLPAAQREVIALAYFGELSTTEIASELSLPLAGLCSSRVLLMPAARAVAWLLEHEAARAASEGPRGVEDADGHRAASAHAVGGRIEPGGDHEPDDVAEVLWRHHTVRDDFQTRLGID